MKKRIFAFWWNPGEMTPNRKESYEGMVRTMGLPVTLIDPSNLLEWIDPKRPPHPIADELNHVIRTDYYRGYFMHTHGGGYADVKRWYYDWTPMWEALNNSKVHWAAGYTERRGRKGTNVKSLWPYHNLLLGYGGFIYKPHTPMSEDWINRLDSYLDEYGQELASLKCHTNPNNRDMDNIYDRYEPQPVRTREALGARLMHPSNFKYHDKIQHTLIWPRDNRIRRNDR